MDEKKKLSPARIVLGIVFLIVALIIIVTFFREENTNSNNNLGDTTGKIINEEQGALITKSLDDMLPTSSELPTEYTIGEKTDITKESSVIISRNAQEGFDSGKRISISKYKITGYSVTDYIEVTFGVYRFDNSNYASNFQHRVVESIKSEGGYTELDAPSDAECFASKSDFGYSGGKTAGSICYKDNIVFWTDISMTNTFKQPDNYLREMGNILDKQVR